MKQQNVRTNEMESGDQEQKGEIRMRETGEEREGGERERDSSFTHTYLCSEEISEAQLRPGTS